jgi:hypothetical protein
LCYEVLKKRNDKWHQWFLHHDKATSHTSLDVQQFLANKSHSSRHPTTVPPGSRSVQLLAVPYSKMGLKETSFAAMEDIKLNATA